MFIFERGKFQITSSTHIGTMICCVSCVVACSSNQGKNGIRNRWAPCSRRLRLQTHLF